MEKNGENFNSVNGISNERVLETVNDGRTLLLQTLKRGNGNWTEDTIKVKNDGIRRRGRETLSRVEFVKEPTSWSQGQKELGDASGLSNTLCR